MVEAVRTIVWILVDNVCTTTPAFRTSIFTYEPTFPVDVQVIAWFEPRTQDSPPFGEVTVMVPEVMAKLLLLVSVIVGVLVLVIRIR